MPDMKKQTWIFLYGLLGAADIAGILLHQELVEAISKSLLMPVLLGYFVAYSRALPAALKYSITGALLFSWAGDVLLIFQGRNDLFFLLGLSAFLLAHICYILFFHKLRSREKIRENSLLFLLIIVLYYSVLMSILFPRLGNMEWPVSFYGLVISYMFLRALHMYSLKNRNAGMLLMTGAGFFVVSDSVLAINKFYQSFAAAPVLVMLTYSIAQWLLTEGALRYGQGDHSR